MRRLNKVSLVGVGMVYSKEIDDIWHEEVYPRPVIANATLKEIQVSKGQNSKLMGLKQKKTHFKLDTNVGKVAVGEFLPLQLKDTNVTLRGYTHTVEMMGYFFNNVKKR